MNDVPVMAFRRLEPADVELASALAASLPAGDPGGESFGLARLKPPIPGEGWGLWMKGTLSGAAWMRLAPAGGAAEVVALVLPRGWRRLGLTAWMLGELATAASAAGCKEIAALVDGGGPDLGEAFSAAGFSGPGPSSEEYPSGKWSKPCG